MARLVYFRHGDTSKTMQTTAAGHLSIQRLADLLRLQANTVELNGVALDFDATGYTTQPLPQDLGVAETNPIIVTGRPVPGIHEGRAPAGGARGDASKHEWLRLLGLWPVPQWDAAKKHQHPYSYAELSVKRDV